MERAQGISCYSSPPPPVVKGHNAPWQQARSTKEIARLAGIRTPRTGTAPVDGLSVMASGLLLFHFEGERGRDG